VLCLAAVVQTGLALKYVAFELQHSPEFVADCIARNGLAHEGQRDGHWAKGKELLLEMVAEEFRADGNFVLAATERRGRALQGAPEHGVGSSFSFTLRKAEGVDFGLAAACREACRAPRVQSVSYDGAVASWNAQCDDDTTRVFPGDLLVEVNGIAIDEQAMLAELSYRCVVRLTVVRGREHAEQPPVIPAAAAQPQPPPSSKAGSWAASGWADDWQAAADPGRLGGWAWEREGWAEEPEPEFAGWDWERGGWAASGWADAWQ
jgi:hypothetical protein